MNRRSMMKAAVALGTIAEMPAAATAVPARPVRVTAKDGTQLFSKDWGEGRPVVFVHSWAVTNDIWQYQHEHLAGHGFRVIAYDRRGHGRSDQPGTGYDSDTLADDLSQVLEAYDLHDAVLVGHSMAAGEIVRCLARHGTRRVAKLALVSPTTPFLLKTADNPDGIEAQAFEALRNLWRRDFPKWMADNARPFFLPDTPQAVIDWGNTMMYRTPVKVAIDCNKSMVESDFRPDCRAVKVPALIVHGTADVSAPFALTGKRTAALIPQAELKLYEGAPHGVMLTHAGRLNADLAAFAA